MNKFLQEAAWRFIIEQNIIFLPVNPLHIASQNGWKVYTYKEFSKITHKSVEFLISRYDNDGFVFWSNCDNTFIICYNSTLPFNICRWTLMHEIGHIYLKHVTAKTPAISRVRTEKRSLFEVEAQGFARRVLCPSIVLHNCKAFEVKEIMDLCGISHEASIYRSRYIKKIDKWRKFGVQPLECKVEEQFKDFVAWYHKHEYDDTFLNAIEERFCA